MSSLNQIDPDGDLILILSRNGLDDAEVDHKNPPNDEMRVSSKVLMLNSPVFKAMLSGNFKEGIELAANSGHSDPYSLEFPDDDVEAMTILCQILHNVYVPERPKPLGLSKLAFVSDKYGCTKALKYCGTVWIRDWLQEFDENVPPMSDFCHLLVFSYVIHLPLEFSDVSWRMFLFHEGPFSSASDQVKMLADHPLLRHDLISKSTCTSLN